MILKKAVLLLAAIAAIAAAAGVAVVAAAFALFALLRDYLGPAGAAAVVAGLAALLAALTGTVCLLVAAPPKRKEEPSLTARALDLAREKPLIAVAAAAAVGLLAVRNPKIVTTALTAFMAGKAAPKK